MKEKMHGRKLKEKVGPSPAKLEDAIWSLSYPMRNLHIKTNQLEVGEIKKRVASTMPLGAKALG